VYAPLPSPEEAAAYAYSDADRARIERLRARAFYGTPDVVGARLRTLAEELGANEVAVLTTLHDQAARRRSYTLLAREFGLVAGDMALAAE
jgi:alkanesulfonate monooxygenase SsuD/methylene tetrahydromethanopterin reductase-like flavin-dependent oxidoreductase (luciferase family)